MKYILSTIILISTLSINAQSQIFKAFQEQVEPISTKNQGKAEWRSISVLTTFNFDKSRIDVYLPEVTEEFHLKIAGEIKHEDTGGATAFVYKCFDQYGTECDVVIVIFKGEQKDGTLVEMKILRGDYSYNFKLENQYK